VSVSSIHLAPIRASRPRPGIASPRPQLPCTSLVSTRTVARGSPPTLISISTAGAIARSPPVVGTAGPHDEQNMLRSTSWVPVRSRTCGAATARATGTGRAAVTSGGK